MTDIVQTPIASIDELKNLQTQKPELFNFNVPGFASLQFDAEGSMYLESSAEVAYELSILDRMDSKGRLRDYVAAARWATEQKGVWYKQNPLRTDSESQRKTSALVMAYGSGLITGNVTYKLADKTWVSIDADLAKEFYLAMQNHVRVCYETEHFCITGVDDGTITTFEQIDARFAEIAVLPSVLWPTTASAPPQE